MDQQAGTRTGLPDDGCVLKCETRCPSGYWCEKDLLSRIWPSPYGHTEQRAKPQMPKSKLTALPERSEQGVMTGASGQTGRAWPSPRGERGSRTHPCRLHTWRDWNYFRPSACALYQSGVGACFVLAS